MVSIGQMKLETQQQQLYDPKSRHQDEDQVKVAYQGPGGLCQGQGGLGGTKEAALQVLFRVTTGVNHHVVPITLRNLHDDIRYFLEMWKSSSYVFPTTTRTKQQPAPRCAPQEGLFSALPVLLSRDDGYSPFDLPPRPSNLPICST